MKLPLNLASQPFRRDRPVLVASGAAAVLLVILLAVLTSVAIAEHRSAAEARNELARLDTSLNRMRAEQAKLDAEVRRPGNAAVLDRSILINTLIRRKAISWTRIFSDLESVLPATVRVAAIRPQVNTRDQLSLDMTVASETPEAVIGFIVKLESSDVFGSTSVSGIAPPTQNDPVYRYRLSVNYAQKL